MLQPVAGALDMNITEVCRDRHKCRCPGTARTNHPGNRPSPRVCSAGQSVLGPPVRPGWRLQQRQRFDG